MFYKHSTLVFFQRFLAGWLVLSAFAFWLPMVDATTVIFRDRTIIMNEDSPTKSVPLSAFGSRGETFSYSIGSHPRNGTANLSGSLLYYTPSANFSGVDTMTIHATGSINGTVQATVTVTVNAVNDIPTATVGIRAETNEGSAVEVQLSGTDVDSNNLKCYAGSSSYGTWVVNADTCRGTYTPGTGFTGTGSAQFRVFDGQYYSSYQSVSITVNPVNELPVASDLDLFAYEDTSLNVLLSASDSDRDALTYEIVTTPQQGSLTFGGGALYVYTPHPHYFGSDSFTYRAYDGQAYSDVAEVTLTILENNDAPIAFSQNLIDEKNQILDIVLAGSDIEGSTLTYGLSVWPQNGRIVSQAGNLLSYRPNEDFVGTDQFTFWVSDGSAYGFATVVISIVETSTAVDLDVGQLVWEVDLGQAQISGAPAFKDGLIYTASYLNEAYVYVIDEMGNLIQSLFTGVNVESSPVVLEDQLILNTVYSGETNWDPSSNDYVVGGLPLENRLGTISLQMNEDGTLNETFNWGNGSMTFGRDGTPGRNVSGDRLYVADVYDPENALGEYPELVVIDSETGESLQSIRTTGWSFSSPVFLDDDSTSSVRDGWLFFGPEVQDYSSSTGAFGGLGGLGSFLAYRVDTEGLLSESPIWSLYDESAEFDRGPSLMQLDGEWVVLTGTENGHLYAVQAVDGTVLWHKQMGGIGFGTLTVSDDNSTVYVAIGVSSGTEVEGTSYLASVVALDARTGEVRWTHSLSNNAATVLVGDAGLYVIGETKVLALDVDGSELWSYDLTDAPYYGTAHLMPGSGLLVFGAGNKLMALQTESTGLSSSSYWPSYRVTAENSGLVQK